jgi:hypothetical protein
MPEAPDLRKQLDARSGEQVVIGFDFPIGCPVHIPA